MAEADDTFDAEVPRRFEGSGIRKPIGLPRKPYGACL